MYKQKFIKNAEKLEELTKTNKTYTCWYHLKVKKELKNPLNNYKGFLRELSTFKM